MLTVRPWISRNSHGLVLANLVIWTSGKELAAALQSTVSLVQPKMNVIVSREQSQATSRFYTVLANCAQIFSIEPSYLTTRVLYYLSLQVPCYLRLL